MLKVLIASHGKFAEGIKSAASIILGEKSHVSFINAYVDDVPLKAKLDSYFSAISSEDQVVVLTDLFGGSVNQAVAPYISKGNVFVIAGINLALVLEIFIRSEESEVDCDYVRMVVDESKKQIMFVNDMLASNSNDDFDF